MADIESLKARVAAAEEKLAGTTPAPMGAPASAERKAATEELAAANTALRNAREQAAEAEQKERHDNAPAKTYEKNVGNPISADTTTKDPDAVKDGRPVNPKS